jgi:hypothetical protein
MGTMNKDNLKQVLISIFVGACVAFLSTLFEGLAVFLKAHSTEVISGATTTAVYIAKAYKA